MKCKGCFVGKQKSMESCGSSCEQFMVEKGAMSEHFSYNVFGEQTEFQVYVLWNLGRISALSLCFTFVNDKF